MLFEILMLMQFIKGNELLADSDYYSLYLSYFWKSMDIFVHLANANSKT